MAPAPPATRQQSGDLPARSTAHNNIPLVRLPLQLTYLSSFNRSLMIQRRRRPCQSPQCSITETRKLSIKRLHDNNILAILETIRMRIQVWTSIVMDVMLRNHSILLIRGEIHGAHMAQRVRRGDYISNRRPLSAMLILNPLLDRTLGMTHQVHSQAGCRLVPTRAPRMTAMTLV